MRISEDIIHKELDRILASDHFCNANRLKRLLAYLVQGAMAGRSSELKEYALGVDVFDRTADFDPRIDTIVRVEAGKLRARLAEFYLDSSDSGVRIDVPKGAYIPSFRVSTPPRDAIAVLPFVAFSNDPHDVWFGDGLAEEIIDQLTRIPDLKVVARTSSFQFRDQIVDVREIARRLGVRFIMEGSVRGAEGRVRVAVQLIDGTDGCHVWSQVFEREKGSLFRLHEDLSRSILEHLQVHLSAPSGSPCNPDAYHQLLEGRYHRNQWHGDSFEKAIRCFDRATALDAQSVKAWSGLAEAHCMQAVCSGKDAAEQLRKAARAATQAIVLDSSLASAHVSLGIVHALHDWNFDASLEELNRAIELAPDCAEAWHWRALVLCVAGMVAESIEAITQARRLDPASLVVATHAGLMLYFAGDYNEAMDQYRRVLATAPGFPEALWVSAWVFERQGRHQEAIDALERVKALTGSAIVQGEIGANLAYLGRRDEARAIAVALESGFEHRFHASPYAIASVYAALGEPETAVKWMAKAFAVRDTWFPWVQVEPRFEACRALPGYQCAIAHITPPSDARLNASRFD